MLRFRPYTASEQFLLEISEDLFPSLPGEVEGAELRVVPHRGGFAIAGYDKISLGEEWDLYLIAESFTGHA